jgi:hypothetical protein
VGLAPTGKRRLVTAHAETSRSPVMGRTSQTDPFQTLTRIRLAPPEGAEDLRITPWAKQMLQHAAAGANKTLTEFLLDQGL